MQESRRKFHLTPLCFSLTALWVGVGFLPGCGEDTPASDEVSAGGSASLGGSSTAGAGGAVGGAGSENLGGQGGQQTASGGQAQGAAGSSTSAGGQSANGGASGANETVMGASGGMGSSGAGGAQMEEMTMGGASGGGAGGAAGASAMGGMLEMGEAGAGGVGMEEMGSQSSVCPEAPGSAPSGQLQASLIDGVVPPDYDFHLYEGPVWIDGALYFSDINPNPWDSVIRRHEPGSNTATDFLVGAGSNGLAVDASGVMYSATARLKEISSYDLGSASQMTAVSGAFNSPNDIAIAADGTIYFSDPQQGELPAGGNPQAVHVVKDGVDALFDETLQVPNGLTLSPDEQFLYVGGGGYSGYLVKFALEDGLAGDMQELATGLQVPDGLTKDCAGNIYVAVHENQEVWVLDPNGNQLATISLGSAANGQAAKPTNVAFGGADGKTLFITATYSLWEIPLDIAGYPY